jgi:hypothetical protein
MNETRKLSELKLWDKNPRSIKEVDFERLKKQIQTLGQYKPLIITKDGTVLGGNMRLRAYQELGVSEIWVSVVDAPTEAKKLEFALSDNDRAGTYDSEAIANLIPNYPEFDWKQFSVDLSQPMTIQDLLDKFDVDKFSEWEGMPEFNQKGEKVFRQILVSFDDAEAVEKFSILVGQDFTDKTKFMWFPKKEKDVLIDKEYKSE